jgi:XTP/dITP diphosphohydrolase
MPRRLVIASRNQHKVDELAAMVARGQFATALEVVSVVGLPGYSPPPDIDESAATFSGNAVLKADAIAGWLRMNGAPRDDLVLADDSGLCVDALDGKPGVYSARFAGPDATDEDNNARLVAELQARGLDSSPAEYVCVLALRNVGPRMFDFTLVTTRTFGSTARLQADLETARGGAPSPSSAQAKSRSARTVAVPCGGWSKSCPSS